MVMVAVIRCFTQNCYRTACLGFAIEPDFEIGCDDTLAYIGKRCDRNHIFDDIAGFATAADYLSKCDCTT